MDDHNDARGISETSRLLLRNSIDTVDTCFSSETRHTIPPERKRRTVILLCAFSFAMMLGDNLQPAALIEIYEAVICDDYYKVYPMPPTSNTTSTVLALDDHCQVQPVQKELALVRGFQQFVPLFPALLYTVPYGLLAERIGRKRVLILSGAGILAALS
jgi:hypothetical protein